MFIGLISYASLFSLNVETDVLHTDCGRSAVNCAMLLRLSSDFAVFKACVMKL